VAPRARRAPISRRDRPAKDALSREVIVATALALSGEGTERVTLRRLAGALETGPASLYVYFRDAEELQAAMLDALLGAVRLRPDTGDWRERLGQVLASYTEVLFAHPGLARAALFTRPSGPHYLALVDALLELLAEGGLPIADAAWVVDLLLQRATATAAENAGADVGADEDPLLRQAVADASPGDYPHLAAAAGELFSGDGPARLAWSFQLLINGALATPRPPAAITPGRAGSVR
jgi:AcrR family transcriptional regulator